MTPAEEKAAARKAALARRAGADPSVGPAACAALVAAVRAASGRVVSAYWPMRSEIDPRPAMEELAASHRLCLPVVTGPGRPLAFRPWAPGAAMEKGAFGAFIPSRPGEAAPDILIVPLAAFDAEGYRLGYGGGFYDRTLAALASRRPVTAFGFAYDLQRVPRVPREATDWRLDGVVTETGLHPPA